LTYLSAWLVLAVENHVTGRGLSFATSDGAGYYVYLPSLVLAATRLRRRAAECVLASC